jgi:hypothetical protein
VRSILNSNPLKTLPSGGGQVLLLSFSYCTWFIFRRNEFLLTKEKQMQCQKFTLEIRRVKRA